MSQTGWVFDERYLLHKTGASHPERPDRLRAIETEVRRRGLLDRVTPLPVEAAKLSLIELNHAPEYIHRVREACAHHEPCIDSVDSAICPESYDVALLAVGGVIAACDAVMTRVCANAFCSVRPPGHHAEFGLSMGFCLFNNCAIAARYLQKQHGVGKVLILDWDVHHGNGTQHSFELDPSVFFCSIHEHPNYCYPGTGFAEETGKGAGRGTTLNIPMMPGASDEEYRTAFEQTFLPAARAFGPEFLLISAGFDAHARDPLAHIELTDAAFTWMADQVTALARDCCGDRCIAILEGGYDLQALSTGVANVVEVLAGVRD